MAYHKILFVLTYLILVDTLVIKTDEIDIKEEESDRTNATNKENDPINTFNGVYTECLLGMSFICLQKKTLLYLKELNQLNEVSVFGDYLKFVRLNTSENTHEEESMSGENSDELSIRIDRAVDKFFDNHLIRFSALGKDLLVPRKVEEFVGRKRRKGGGGGGHGGGDGGKKKMMMMAMMCMKMKFMMMIPAMMGMMGMMSFKGMMFSMMSFLIAKMMLLMKILEKKGGGGGGGGGGSWAGDGGWAAGGGGGAWMPAGQDYGGGYDANGQWQSRSIIEEAKDVQYNKGPIISYVKPTVRYNNNNNDVKKVNDEIVKIDHEASLKSRKKRGLIDVLQNAYMYWTKVLGPGRKKHFYPKYKVINGMKYVYSPIRNVPKIKTPKELKPVIKNTEDTSQIITIDNYNKGEIIEAGEGRMNRRKFYKIKDNVNETMDDNPWE